MKKHTLKTLSFLIALALAMISCRLLTSELEPDADLEKIVAQTMAAMETDQKLDELMTPLEPDGVDLDSDQTAITITPAEEPTDSTGTADTPCEPTVQVSVNTNCRVGPGQDYPRVGSLLVGQTAQVIGRNADSTYWIIERPGGAGHCWLWGAHATVTCETADLAIYEPPPTPTPIPPNATHTPTLTATAIAAQLPSKIEPVDEPFPIAESSDWEDSPAIAYGGDYFLVVYRKAGRIWGSFYDNHGVLTSIWFPESPETNFNTPRVAYSHDTDQFLVTYHDANRDNICVATLSYPDPPDARLCSSMADNIQNPDITCVNPGNTCLIVFESDQGIMGFYVTLDGLGVQAGGLQNFSDRPGERPFITYGTGDVAMITFTWTDPDSGERFPMYNPVSASRHGNAPLQEAKFVRDFSGAPWVGTDKEASGITYDPCTEKFVLIYDHIDTPGSISDVWGAAIGVNPPYDNYWNGPFAYGFTQQQGGGISFLTAEGYSASCGEMNKLVVTYTDLTENRVYAVEITGNNDKSSPSYTNSQSSAEHFLVVDLSTSFIPHEQPVISGSDFQGRMMIAYSMPELLFGSNIFGWLIDVAH